MNFFDYRIDRDSIREEDLYCVLSMNTVAEIKQLVDRLRLPVKKSVTKNRLIESVSTFLSEHPEYVVDKLSAAEISVLRRLMDGERIVGEACVLSEFHILVALGWIIMRTLYDDALICELVLTAKAETLLRPLLDRMTLTRARRIEQFVTGWSTLCGVLPLDDVLARLRKMPGLEDVTADEISQAIDTYGKPGFRMYSPELCEGRGGEFYLTPWTRAIDKIAELTCKLVEKDDRTIGVNIFAPKEFTDDEIIRASVALFEPRLPDSVRSEGLADLCRREGLKEDAVRLLQLNCWKERQGRGDDRPDVGRLATIFGYRSPEDSRIIRSVLSDYISSIPMWRYMGMSEEEYAATNTD